MILVSALQGEVVTYMRLDRLPVDISEVFAVEWEQNNSNVSHYKPERRPSP